MGSPWVRTVLKCIRCGRPREYHGRRTLCQTCHDDTDWSFPARLRQQRLRDCLNTLTPEQWEAIKTLYGQRCAYCGSLGTVFRDHVVPISRGGDNVVSNIVPACTPCNSSKGSKMVEANRFPIRLML